MTDKTLAAREKQFGDPCWPKLGFLLHNVQVLAAFSSAYPPVDEDGIPR